MHYSSMRMTTIRSNVVTTVLIALVVLNTLDTVSGLPYKRSLLRLCSTSLSDALFLVCQGRGYNEPFSYSGEDDPQESNGPGLADECCYHTCSYAQLEQYCKPSSDNDHPVSADAVKVSFWILKIPYLPLWVDTSSEERSRLKPGTMPISDIDKITSTLKCKIYAANRTEKKGINACVERGHCNGESRIKNPGGRCKCRHLHQHRRLCKKILGKALKAEWSKPEV